MVDVVKGHGAIEGGGDDRKMIGRATHKWKEEWILNEKHAVGRSIVRTKRTVEAVWEE